MDVAVCLEKTFLMCKVQQGAVGDLIVLVDATAPLLRVPRVEMCVEMDDGDWAPGLVDAAQGGQSCGRKVAECQ
jgi:hypothetical protein